jgi:hypothetical protein
MGRQGFIEPQELPALTLAALAAASHLKGAHDVVSVLCDTYGVNLDDARESVIAEFKALPCSESLASG